MIFQHFVKSVLTFGQMLGFFKKAITHLNRDKIETNLGVPRIQGWGYKPGINKSGGFLFEGAVLTTWME